MDDARGRSSEVDVVVVVLGEEGGKGRGGLLTDPRSTHRGWVRSNKGGKRQ